MNPLKIGATINGIHTYTDLGLTTEKIEISEPVAKTSLITVPYRPAPIDATEALGGLTYEPRTVRLFTVFVGSHAAWITSTSKIQNRLAGRLCQIKLDEDPNYYWIGRPVITSVPVEHKKYKVTFEFTVEPFKYYLEAPSSDWLWDPFSFESGVIQNLQNRTVSGTESSPYVVTVTGTEQPAVPKVIASAAMKLVVDGAEYQLIANEPLFLQDIVLFRTPKQFKFYGSGSVSIIFTGESL